MSKNLITKGSAVVGNLTVPGTLLVTGTMTTTGTTTSSVTCTFTVGVEASNIINVAIQLKDAGGVNLAVAKALNWYLATNSTGLTPATVAPQTSLAAGTNGKLIEWITDLSGLIITTATGAADINITDTGTPTFYMVVVLPNSSLAVSAAITFA